jgi:rubrerythrin
MMKEDRTAFEKEFSIDLADRNLDVSKGIEISLKVEIEGRQFYAHNAKAIQNIDIKRFIEFLAGEEDKHIAILREVKESLKTRGAWVDFHEDRKTLSKVQREGRKRDKVCRGRHGAALCAQDREGPRGIL